MARQFLTHIDLARNQLQNAVVHNLGGPPSSPVKGLMYFDTTSNLLMVYNGTAWIAATATDVWVNNTGDAMTGDLVMTGAGIYGKDATNTINYGNMQWGPAAGADVALRTSGAGRTIGLINNGVARLTTSDTGVTVGGTMTLAADPTLALQAATKQYVDGVAQGLEFKASVRVATATAGTLASSFEVGDVVDGIALALGDRILIKDQPTGSENGIYTVNATGAPTRATDANASGEIAVGTLVYVEVGTNNGSQQWVCTTIGGTLPWVPGTNSSTWAQFSGASATTAGAGLISSGNTFAVGQGTGITVNANDVAINTSVVARKSVFNVVGGSTTETLTHNFNNLYVDVTVYTSTTGAQVEFDVTPMTVNTVLLTATTTIAAATYTAVIIG